MDIKNKKEKSFLYYFFIIILILFTCIQVIQQFPQIVSDLVFIRQNIGQTANNRGSRLFGGNKYGEQIEFLDMHVPKNIDLVLPPEKLGLSNFGSSSVLAYYLAPRKFESCGSSYLECIEYYQNTHAIIYFNQGFVASELPFNPEQMIMMDDDFGVIIPEAFLSEIPLAKNTYENIEQIILDLGLGLLFLGGYLISGYLIVESFFPDLNFPIKVSIGFGLGIGFYSFILFILLILGIPFSSMLIWAEYATLILVSCLIFSIKNKKNKRKFQLPRLSTIDWFLLPIFFLGGIVMILAVGKGYFMTDGIILWGSKGIGIVEQGLIKGVSEWGTQTASYPLNIPLLIATFKALFKDFLPQSKLIFSAYYLSLLLFIYGYLKPSVGKEIAMGSAIFLGTVPTIFIHGTIAYANLPAAYYFCAGILVIEHVFRKPSKNPIAYVFLGSLFITFAAWTRPETMTLAMVIIVLAVFFGIKRWPKMERNRQIAWMIFPFIVLFVIWKISAPQIYVNSSNNDTGVLFDGLREFLSGNFHISDGKYIINYFSQTLFDLKLWGGFGYSVVFLTIVLVIRLKFIAINWRPIIFGLVYIVFVLGSYHLLGYQENGSNDVSWWVTTGLMRMAMPGILLIWVSIVKIIKLEN